MIKERKNFTPEMMWNVEKLYSSWEDWDEDLKKLYNSPVSPKWPQIII